MKLNLFLFLTKAVSHVSVFYVCQPIIFNLFILIILNLVTVSFDFYLAFTAPEGGFCLTEILGNKIITLLSCPNSLAIGFLHNISLTTALMAYLTSEIQLVLFKCEGLFLPLFFWGGGGGNSYYIPLVTILHRFDGY